MRRDTHGRDSLVFIINKSLSSVVLFNFNISHLDLTQLRAVDAVRNQLCYNFLILLFAEDLMLNFSFAGSHSTTTIYLFIFFNYKDFL